MHHGVRRGVTAREILLWSQLEVSVTMSRSRSRAMSLATVVALAGACRRGADHAVPSARPSPSDSVRTEDNDAAIARVENSTAEAVERGLRISGLTSAVRHLHGGPP